ncbi:hypothetical protein GGI26_006267 [Coemansia sp. RSA 1358]|uniref:Shugoshin C-terminal domain-containing protein n=1 Tax=Coemansia umbellata TaxID=1424467 RepID=A0ABQ8PDM7_9FUNG|nr:hypothetical protein EDC05_006140 [Coemansia umbellata]KAJ2618884.1 hypothetical protein GGI26_006267 [Coemansia sp. RSA 1358]
MSDNSTVDREARRKARYRGNPERARFHRQDTEGFEIKARDGLDRQKTMPVANTTRSNTALVRGLRRLSIKEPASVSGTDNCEKRSMAYTNGDAHSNDSDKRITATNTKELLSGVQNHGQQKRQEVQQHADKANCTAATETKNSDTATLAASPEDEPEFRIEQPAESDAELQSEEEGIDSKVASNKHTDNCDTTAQEDTTDNTKQPPDSSVAKPKKQHRKGSSGTRKENTPDNPEKPVERQKQNRQRQRENIDIIGIDKVLNEVPERMTRSMARKIGVQAPRRYFGEGVSTSQILRPSNDRKAKGKPAKTQTVEEIS